MSAGDVVSERGAIAGAGLLSTIALEFFGLPLRPIVWGLIGGFLGTGFTKTTSVLRGIGIYLCASLLSAAIGHMLAVRYADGSPEVADVLSGLMGFSFHPVMSALASKVPEIVSGVVTAVLSAFKGGRS